MKNSFTLWCCHGPLPGHCFLVRMFSDLISKMERSRNSDQCKNLNCTDAVQTSQKCSLPRDQNQVTLKWVVSRD